MMSEELMRKCVGKNIRIKHRDGTFFESKCEEFVRSEDENEEAMLFFPNNIAALQSEIENIEILD